MNLFRIPVAGGVRRFPRALSAVVFAALLGSSAVPAAAQTFCFPFAQQTTQAVGTQHTASVFVIGFNQQSQQYEPLVGFSINARVVIGPNAVKTFFLLTNGSGVASFSYLSNGQHGEDTIAWTGANGAGLCIATVRWIELSCTLLPTGVQRAVNTNHTITSTVTLDGAPAPGITVNFNITAGPNSGINGAGTTNANGQTSFTYLGGPNTGTDHLRASGSFQGVPFQCNATCQWLPAPTCSIPASESPLAVGSQHSVTATLVAGTTPLPNQTMNFFISEGPNAGASDRLLTDNNGNATFSYVGTGGAGTDTIVAGGTALDTIFSCQTTQDWIVVNPACSLDPPTDSNAVSTQHTVTVTFTNDGSPVQGQTINFAVTAGPNTGQSGSDTTDADGQATFTYAGGPNFGTDTITASGSYFGSFFQCAATKTWIAAACSLSPPTDTNRVGTQHTTTVTVSRNGAAAAGINVTFNVTAGPNAGQSAIIATNTNGQADFIYNGSATPGTDTIQASGSVTGVPFQCSASKEWINADCSLAPAADTNQINTQHTVTVTVNKNGSPQSGVHVAFNVSVGPNIGQTGSGATNGSGQASFTYTGGSSTGTDLINAAGNIDGVPFQCTASKTWVNPVTTLLPYFSSRPTNTSITLTCTVLLNGAPQSGVNVAFNVIAGPNTGVNGAGATNGAGQTTFSYTGVGGGFDTIRATGTVAGFPFDVRAINSLIVTQDCNNNGIDDVCDLGCGAPTGPCFSPDPVNHPCGTSLDDDFNGWPDECPLPLNAGDGAPANRTQPPSGGGDAGAPNLTAPLAAPSSLCASGAGALLAPLTWIGLVLITRRTRRS